MPGPKVAFAVVGVMAVAILALAGLAMFVVTLMGHPEATSKTDLVIIKDRSRLLGLSRDISSVRIVDKDLEDLDLTKYLEKSDLEFLDVTGCRRISSAGLTALPHHRHLRVLIISKTSVDSRVNDILVKCPSIERLDLSWTNVQKLEEKTVAGMQGLTWLEASGCNIDKATLDCVARDMAMTRLSIRSMATLGPLDFQVLAQSKSLAVLNLSDNTLDEQCLRVVMTIPTLRTLLIGDVRGVDKEAIRRLQTLRPEVSIQPYP